MVVGVETQAITLRKRILVFLASLLLLAAEAVGAYFQRLLSGLVERGEPTMQHIPLQPLVVEAALMQTEPQGLLLVLVALAVVPALR
jgi:hypothetical protein